VLFCRLLHLKYLLLWARFRRYRYTPAVIILTVLSAVWMFVSAGMGGIVSGLLTGRIADIHFPLSAIFGIAYCCGVAVSVFLWSGIDPVFSDIVLRHFPLSRMLRFTVRRAVSATDLGALLPALFVTATVGGLIFRGRISAGTALLGLLLFLMSMHLSSAAAVAIITTFLSSSAPRAVAGALLCLLAAALPMFIIDHRWATAVADIGGLFKCLPPFVAVSLVVERRLNVMALGLLIMWMIVLGLVVQMLEGVEPGTSANTRSITEAQLHRAYLALGTGRRVLEWRSLRYYFRSNRVRFAVVGWIAMMAFLRSSIVRHASPGCGFVVLAGLVFLTPLATLGQYAMNSMGYDAAGFGRLLLSPVSHKDILRANSWSPLLLGFCISGLIAALFFVGLSAHDFRIAFLFASCGAAGSMFANSLFTFSSVFFCRRAMYDRVLGSDLGPTARFLIGTGFLPLVACFALNELVPVSLVLRFWWVALLVVALCWALQSLSYGLALTRLIKHNETIFLSVI
jgi:hypothetical protein